MRVGGLDSLDGVGPLLSLLLLPTMGLLAYKLEIFIRTVLLKILHRHLFAETWVE